MTMNCVKIKSSSTVAERFMAWVCGTFACWDCGFQSHRRIGRLSLVNFGCSQSSLHRPITRPEESYRMWCVCDRKAAQGRPWPTRGSRNIVGGGGRQKERITMLQYHISINRLKNSVWYLLTRDIMCTNMRVLISLSP
jgi:hypothetical protein